MGILLVLNLWTTRLLIRAMGVDGYGLWSLILSIVLLWSFLGDIVGETIMRYVSVTLTCRHNQSQLYSLTRVFVRLYLYADIVMVILSVTLGYCWLTTQAILPTGDEMLAQHTFFITVAMMMIKTLNVPFLSYLVANEKFRKYVILSLTEGIGSFLTALILTTMPQTDSIIYYAWMLTGIEIVILLIYIYACRHEIPIPNTWKLELNDRNLMRECTRYILWMAIGSSAVIIWTQGMNIAVNHIYGLEATAACAIAMGLLVRLRGLCANVQRAVQPRIMKLYSSRQKSELKQLLSSYLTVSVALITIICVPIYIFTPQLLQLWLVDVPPLTVLLTRVVILSAWIVIFEMPLNAIIHAAGTIKKFEIAEGSVLLLIIPVFCLTALLGKTDIVTAFSSQLAVLAIALIIRIFISTRYLRRLQD